MAQHPGVLYLIPLPIAEGNNKTLSPEVGEYTARISHYFVEDVRTARRFLRTLHQSLVIENIEFSLIGKHSGPDTALLSRWLKQGMDVGVMSEAGCPGIADPGAALVAVAQDLGATVVPLVGPSSLILALMASGLNGQSFAFTGYLPIKEPARSQRIKELENLSAKYNQTQFFIETPYRNGVLLAEICKHCQPKTRLCIAQNITATNAFIHTKTIGEWNKARPELGKDPAVFLILAQP